MNALTTHTLRSADEYHALRSEMIDLFQRARSPWSAVAHPEWVEAWWRSRPSNRPITCATIWRGDSLVAAFPFEYVKKFHLPLRKAASLNMGWGWSSALVDDEATGDCCAPLVEWLEHASPRWSVLELGLFPPASSLTDRLPGVMNARQWHDVCLTHDVASLPLPDSYQHWYAARGKHLRRKIRRSESKAAANQLTVHTTEHVTGEHLAAVVGAVSQHSWQGDAGLAVYGDESNRSFYRLLCSGSQDLVVVLHHVEDGAGKPLAYVVAVRTDDVVHHVDTGFDKSAAEYSPGLLATVEGVQWACATHAVEIDLGIHAEYKDRFDPLIVEGRGIRITRGLGGLIARARSTI